MPFNEALFWFGLTAFGTGLYFLFEPTVKRRYSIGVTIAGLLACAYAEYRHYHPELPAIHLWVILLVLTWTLLGYAIYIRRPRSGKDTGIGLEWRAGFSRPRFELINDHKFENEEIVVDNKSFRRCSFKNVKLLFHGNAPFEFVEGTTLDSGSVIFTTDDPAILTFDVMQRKFASIPGAKIQHGALDSKGKDVPISPVTVESVATPSEPSQYPIPDLRLRVLAMCSELQGFMVAHGHEPEKPQRELPETKEAFLHRYRQWQQDKITWGTKFAGDFRLQLLDRISHLRDEMLAKAHINDFELTAAIETAANDHTAMQTLLSASLQGFGLEHLRSTYKNYERD